MGYLVVGMTVLLLVFFVIQKMRQTKKSLKPVEQEGYYLLISKIEDSGQYYGVFQQGDIEVTLQLSANLYVQLQAPIRGYLKASAGKVASFEI